MHRTSKGGSYRLDRVFPGVGRIVRASGATTRREFEKRDAFLTRLHEKGRDDLLGAIKAGTYTISEVYAAYVADERLLDFGANAVLKQPLWATVDAWIPRSAPRARVAHPVRHRVEVSAAHGRTPRGRDDCRLGRRRLARPA
jgi:hypothetical protein